MPTDPVVILVVVSVDEAVVCDPLKKVDASQMLLGCFGYSCVGIEFHNYADFIRGFHGRNLVVFPDGKDFPYPRKYRGRIQTLDGIRLDWIVLLERGDDFLWNDYVTVLVHPYVSFFLQTFHFLMVSEEFQVFKAKFCGDVFGFDAIAG